MRHPDRHGRVLAISAVALACFVQRPANVAGQRPVLELDHVYIVVPPGAAAGVAALRAAGIQVDTAANRHDGQGTASVAAFFENAYLELLWVDSSVAVDAEHRADLADFTRAASQRSGASPFGLGLHFLSGTEADLPFPTRVDSAKMRPGVYYVLLRQPAESLAPDMFIMPAQNAVTAWIARFRSRRPEFFAHASGARRITRVTLRGPSAQRPRAADLDLRPVAFETSESPCLVLELDGAIQGRTLDLRPALPLILQR